MTDFLYLGQKIPTSTTKNANFYGSFKELSQGTHVTTITLATIDTTSSNVICWHTRESFELALENATRYSNKT